MTGKVFSVGTDFAPATILRLDGGEEAYITTDEYGRNVAGEGIAVDADGNIYVAEGLGSRPAVDGGLTKYVRC